MPFNYEPSTVSDAHGAFLEKAFVEGRIVVVSRRSYCFEIQNFPIHYLWTAGNVVRDFSINMVRRPNSFDVDRRESLTTRTIPETLDRYSHDHYWFTLVGVLETSTVLAKIAEHIPNFWEMKNV